MVKNHTMFVSVLLLRTQARFLLHYKFTLCHHHNINTNKITDKINVNVCKLYLYFEMSLFTLILYENLKSLLIKHNKAMAVIRKQCNMCMYYVHIPQQ